MLNSLKHLNRVYERPVRKIRKLSAKKPRIQTVKVSRLKLPAGFLYSGTLIVHRYFGKDLKHFGIFSGDTLTIERQSSFLSVKSDALYAVQLAGDQTRICAVSYRGLTTVLHDGQGNDFKEYRTTLLTLIGEVIKGAECRNVALGEEI